MLELARGHPQLIDLIAIPVDGPASAVMAGLVPAIHAFPALQSVIGTDNQLGSKPYIKTAVFSWMAGSSPAMTSEPRRKTA
jgi:hypothetical protein